MALNYSGISYQLREVQLKNKTQALLSVSSKATVPVLVNAETVIDESLDIMQWAINQSDPEEWATHAPDHPLIARNDGYFKFYLDRYKYFQRYPQQSQQFYFDQASVFLAELEDALQADSNSGNVFLESPRVSLIDIAIFPFVRQFAAVDRVLFDTLALPKLVYWLNYFLASPLFAAVMGKYPVWVSPESEPVLFGVR